MRVNRLAGALIAYLVLGVLAVATLSDERIRAVTLLILGLFAVKTWVRRKDVLHPDGEREADRDLFSLRAWHEPIEVRDFESSASELHRSLGAKDAPQDDKKVDVRVKGPM
jgi:hypothetical protein